LAQAVVSSSKPGLLSGNAELLKLQTVVGAMHSEPNDIIIQMAGPIDSGQKVSVGMVGGAAQLAQQRRLADLQASRPLDARARQDIQRRRADSSERRRASTADSERRRHAEQELRAKLDKRRAVAEGTSPPGTPTVDSSITDKKGFEGVSLPASSVPTPARNGVGPGVQSPPGINVSMLPEANCQHNGALETVQVVTTTPEGSANLHLDDPTMLTMASAMALEPSKNAVAGTSYPSACQRRLQNSCCLLQ